MYQSKQRIVHFLSTAFLIVSLALAGGISAHALTAQDAEASFNDEVSPNAEICDTSYTYFCDGLPTNCLCEIVVEPEED